MKNKVILFLGIFIILCLFPYTSFSKGPTPTPNILIKIEKMEKELKNLQKSLNQVKKLQQPVDSLIKTYDSGLENANRTYTIMQIILVFFGFLFVGGIVGGVRLYFIGEKRITNRISKIMDDKKGFIQDKAKEEITSNYADDWEGFQKKIKVFESFMNLLSMDENTQVKELQNIISKKTIDPRIRKLIENLSGDSNNSLAVRSRALEALYACGDTKALDQLKAMYISMLSEKSPEVVKLASIIKKEVENRFQINLDEKHKEHKNITQGGSSFPVSK